MIVFQLFKKFPEEIKKHYNVNTDDPDDLIDAVGKEKGFFNRMREYFR